MRILTLRFNTPSVLRALTLSNQCLRSNEHSCDRDLAFVLSLAGSI